MNEAGKVALPPNTLLLAFWREKPRWSLIGTRCRKEVMAVASASPGFNGGYRMYYCRCRISAKLFHPHLMLPELKSPLTERT